MNFKCKIHWIVASINVKHNYIKVSRVNSCFYRFLCVIVFMLATTNHVYAEAKLNSHYIIAFDLSLWDKYDSDYNSKKVLSRIESLLEQSGFDGKEDYLSIVGYTMYLDPPSQEDFVMPFTWANDGPALWRKTNGESLEDVFPYWPIGQPELKPDTWKYASMQSLAKPYAVMETANRFSETGVEHTVSDRVFVLLVTDNVVNGTDDNYFEEWKNVSTCGERSPYKTGFDRVKNDVFTTMRGFNELFSFYHIRECNISEDGVYKIIQYEVLPNQIPSLNSVSDFPSLLPLKRIKGGYRMNLEISPINPNYEIKEIQIFDSSGQLLCETHNGVFDVEIPSNDLILGDTLSVAMTLHYKDGVYNGLRMSCNNERYERALVVNQVVKLQDEAKVLGLLPLTDSYWWWSYDDAFTAVMIWDLIILVIFIIAIALVLYICFVIINRYRPSNKNIKIKKI